MLDRRQWLGLSTAGIAALNGFDSSQACAAEIAATHGPLKITGLKVTPIALPDPPILAASGCHGPYFLRNVVQLETDAGIVGIGETNGGESVTRDLEQARALIRRPECLRLSHVRRQADRPQRGLLCRHRAGLPRRLRPGHGPAAVRAARRAGARGGRVRRLSVLSLRRRPSQAAGRSPDRRQPRPRRQGARRLGRSPHARERWPRWP